ncbi:MAG: bifunctional folylpolyglutamate synthase/dihydrofolate synthase [Tannerella sp.]|jgi:dihydrofolate synthase/folylpolyglutamate synthase|nr:bifunctional folylpolyglutamate synthase/dihydrofolate synthase [Tannerella sp.]
MTYKETLHFLSPSFQQVGAPAYKPGLDRMIALDDYMNHPHKHYRTIHVAGTNGKGSVSHLLAAILRNAKYKVGLYTSPHLIDFCERICVNGKKISKRFVVDFVERHKSKITEVQPSFFDLTTILALEYFHHKKVDFAVIETGLGGRLDSTNIIEPALCIITNISFDHQQYLGDTLREIATEKAGIIKPFIPVVIGEADNDDVRCVLSKQAMQMNAPITFASEETVWQSCKKQNNGEWLFQTLDYGTFTGELRGSVQKQNARTVLTVLRLLSKMRVKLPVKAVQQGFEHVTTLTNFRGRWQTLQTNPLIICDTGHNEGAWESLADDLQQEAANHRTLRMVIGMVSDKDLDAVLALMPKQAVYYFTNASVPRAMPSLQFAEKAKQFDLLGSNYGTVKEAVKEAIRDSSPQDMIFIGGSTFVVGDALPFFCKKQDISDK